MMMMMMVVRFTSILIWTALWLEQGFSFVPCPTRVRYGKPFLFLTPQQASELVRASQDIYRLDKSNRYSDNEDNDNDDNDDAKDDEQLKGGFSPVVPVDKFRSFVRRVFRLPSSLWHPPHPKAEGADIYEGDEVVYFPIVGFTFVQDEPGHSRVLPKVSNPSCRLHDEKEPLYGWFRHPNSQGDAPSRGKKAI